MTEITPVKLEIKEFYNKPNRLYVAISLEGIKKTGVVSMGDTNEMGPSRTSPVTIGITDLIRKVHTADVDFLKYIPNELLTDEQITAKNLV